MKRRNNMSESDHVLDEVVVRGTKLKFYFDNDTLIYNADAFTTQKGFVLNDILKKMPGVNLTEDGKIYANGKLIDELLIDGKNFFNKDRGTVLDNLPAFMVNKVKVYETQKDSVNIVVSDEKPHGNIMDIILKPDYHAIALGNIDAGIGTGKRYYGKLFGMKLNDLGRLSLFAIGNNINKDELINSDGNTTSQFSDIGDYTIDKIGLNYNYINKKRVFQAFGDAEYKYINNNREYTRIEQMMLDAGNRNNRNFGSTNEYINTFITRNRLDFFMNSAWAFSMNPYVSFSRNRASSNSIKSSFAKDVYSILGEHWKDSLEMQEPCDALKDHGISRERSSALANNDRLETKVDLSKNIRVPHTYNDFDFYASFRFVDVKGNDDILSEIEYLQLDSRPNEIKNYNRRTNKKNMEETISANYRFLLSYSSSMSIGYSFLYNKSDYDRLFYILNNDFGKLGDFNNSNKDLDNSYEYIGTQKHHQIRWLYSYQKKGIQLNIEVPFRVEFDKLAFRQFNNDTLVKRRLIMPDAGMTFGYDWNNHKGKFISVLLRYKLDSRMPELLDLVNRHDNINPLNITHGNPNLKNSMSHNLSGRFLYKNRIDVHSINIQYILTKNRVTFSRLINNNTGAAEITPQNISGNKSLGFNLSNKVYLPKNIVNFFSQFQLGYNLFKDFIDTEIGKLQEEKEIRNMSLNENLGIGFTSRNTKYMASCSGYVTYNKTKSVTEAIGKTDVYDYGIKINTTIECPWDFRLKSDFTTVNRYGYNYNNRTDMEHIWNVYVSKSFTENMTLSLECFDILNQLKSFSYYVNGQMRSEYFQNNLKRYAMLHFVYRLNSKNKQTPSHIDEHHSHNHNHIH